MTSETVVGHRLNGATLWSIRVAWLVLAALALVLWGVGTVRFMAEPVLPAAQVTDPSVFTVEDMEVLRDLGLPEVLATAPVAFFLALDVVYFAVAGWIFWRRSHDVIALLVSFALVALGAVIFSYSAGALSRAEPVWVILLNLMLFLAMVSPALLLYLFPDGKFVPGWMRLLAIPLAAAFLLSFLTLTSAFGQTLALIAIVGFLATGVSAQVYRYRRFSSPVQRQQTKWIALGLAMTLVGLAMWFASTGLFPPTHPGRARVYFLLAVFPFGVLVGVMLPASVGIAILRHRLWDVDVVINRTLVYAPLTGILMGLYVGSIRLFQTLFLEFTGERSSFSILLSTLVLAGAFMPLRLRLQALADRYLKDTSDPTQGLKAFGEQMRSLSQLTDVGYVTRRLLDEAFAAFHAESGAVFLEQGGELRLVQTAGMWRGNAKVNVPLENARNQRIGQLSLGPRSKGQEYTSQDLETLREIATAAAQALALSLRES